MDRESKAALWRERLAACRQSGLTVREYCRLNSLRTKSYYYWKRRLADADTSIPAGGPAVSGAAPTAWLCVEPASSALPCPHPSLIVKISGAEIDVHSGFDAALLRSIVQALGGGGC